MKIMDVLYYAYITGRIYFNTAVVWLQEKSVTLLIKLDLYWRLFKMVLSGLLGYAADKLLIFCNTLFDEIHRLQIEV